MYFNQKEFGQRLQDARKAAGLTQQELANKVSVERQHISRMERGDRYCSLDLLVELSVILNVTTDHLLKGVPTRSEQAATLDQVIEQLTELRQKI